MTPFSHCSRLTCNTGRDDSHGVKKPLVVRRGAKHVSLAAYNLIQLPPPPAVWITDTWLSASPGFHLPGQPMAWLFRWCVVRGDSVQTPCGHLWMMNSSVFGEAAGSKDSLPCLGLECAVEESRRLPCLHDMAITSTSLMRL
ncbi:hypothetical protein BHE74_00045371 [Ensete ventricosum]|nr:hypothetical protein BHE74_00045371 [Ensete ventricosum]